jgi:C-terminal processing protease CtpA/Prc
MARVCTKRDMYPDGTEWNGKGIQPAILVKPTVADVQAGRDTVLDAALAHLGVRQTAIKDKSRKGK